jgi:hypothetical protein
VDLDAELNLYPHADADCLAELDAYLLLDLDLDIELYPDPHADSVAQLDTDLLTDFDPDFELHSDPNANGKPELNADLLLDLDADFQLHPDRDTQRLAHEDHEPLPQRDTLFHDLAHADQHLHAGPRHVLGGFRGCERCGSSHDPRGQHPLCGR